MDRLAEPGLRGLITLFKYSLDSAIVQALLMATGALLVPVGTLLVTTGEYAAPSQGVGIVGMPTPYSGGATMGLAMGVEDCFEDICKPLNTSDVFITGAVDLFLGGLFEESGVLPHTDSPIGPSSTLNLTFEDGVTYEGVVAFNWESNCAYTDEVSFTQQQDYDVWLIDNTWPDGSTSGNVTVANFDILMYNDGQSVMHTRNTTLHLDGSNYVVTAGMSNQTKNYNDIEQGIVRVNGPEGIWTSIVKCTPSLNWQVSKCTWSDDLMRNCTPSPNSNTTRLDDPGLNALGQYMNGLPWTIYEKHGFVLGTDSLQVGLTHDPNGSDSHINLAPTLQKHNDLFGLAAKSLATYATSGFCGTATVSTTGSTPKPVYIMRMYILALVIAMLIGVPVLTIASLLSIKMRHRPLRRLTFLTIANAVRGKWWDGVLNGGGVMSPSELRNRHNSETVAFGVDVADPKHVGLAPEVMSVENETVYL